jgi:hypothetical protein
VAGVYDVLFERQRGTWRIREMDVLLADDELMPADPYCQERGDMTEYDVSAYEHRVEEAERQVARRHETHAKAEAQARDAQERAAADPDSSGRARNAARRLDKAEREAEKLAKAEANLAEAREGLAKAQADLAEFRQLIGPARDAEKIREMEGTES